jgi:DNA polymerase III subunit delta'
VSPTRSTARSTRWRGRVPDVFDRLVGQTTAAADLRRHALAPVHAYLFVGPSGSGLSDAVLCFAAALQCPDHGCGHCEACRLVLSGNDPDVTFVERSGLTWRVPEIREAERVGRRRPLGDSRQIVVIEDVELTTTGSSPSASALLKSLEEPPPRTVYLLTTEATSPELETIASRCVQVALRSLGEDDLVQILQADGVDAETARVAASAANGNLQRARVLVRDADLVARVARWRAVPERLNGTPARASEVVAEIVDALDGAVAPLAAVQDEEMVRRTEEARAVGQRAVANRRDVEAQFKREQRRFRTDDLRFGLSALTDVYRERIVDDLELTSDARSSSRLDASLRAVDAIAETNRRLSLNVDESLLLTDLLLNLSGLP